MMPPSTGFVTFLFTDIAGSTRRWETAPEAMASALDRHNAIIHAAIGAYRGQVFKTIGDAFCAAFTTPGDALLAAVDAQRRLCAEPWSAISWGFDSLQVRMALHSGIPRAHEDDYFGPPVNSVARLLGTAHGGQIVLSETTESALAGALPPAIALVDLGRYMLRDIARPMRVFQVLADGIPARFPRLRTRQSPGQVLPTPATSFVGRSMELKRLKRLVRRQRLITLVGPGGIGKTRLALALGHGVGSWFEWFAWADLSSITDPDGVVPAVAASAQTAFDDGSPPLDRVRQAVDDRSGLLILDCCEHLVASAASAASRLLEACPSLHILATSREALGVAGEVVWPVEPLKVADESEVTIATARRSPAVSLFIARARAVLPEFDPDEVALQTVVRLCRGLDGLPLAIELAAARMRVMALPEIAGQLGDPLRLLAHGPRTVHARQQTLRATIAWSYDLLTPPEQALFVQLAIFQGGWTADSAAVVCGGPELGSQPVRQVLFALVEKSLVAAESHGDVSWYRFLDVVHAFAFDLARQPAYAPTLVGLEDRLLAWAVSFAEEAGRHADDAVWLAMLRRQNDNLRAALQHAATKGDRVAGLRLSSAIWRHWWLNGHLAEGSQWIETFKAEAWSAAPDATRAQALHASGSLAYAGGDFELARRFLEEAYGLRRATADPDIGITLNNLAALLQDTGRLAEARALYAEALTLHQVESDPRLRATLLANSAEASRRMGAMEDARDAYGVSLRVAESAGYVPGIADAMYGLATLATDAGDWRAADNYGQAAVARYAVLGDRRSEGYAQRLLAEVELNRGDAGAARRAIEAGLSAAADSADDALRVECLAAQGELALQCGDARGALPFLHASLAIAEQIQARAHIARALELLARAACRQFDPALAIRYLLRSRTLRLDGSPALTDTQSVLEGFVDLAAAEGNWLIAAQLAGTLLSLLERHGVRPGLATRTIIDAALAGARAVLGHEADGAVAEGQVWDIEQALDLVATAWPVSGERDGNDRL